MFMQIDNKKIYYEITGTGQTVVFCHGFGGNHVVWSEQVAYLAKKGYQTITFDHIGHGQSQGPAATTVREVIDDMARLIKKLALKSVILVGHSMGAGIVWGLMLYHPEIDVTKIISIDQTPKMLNDADWNYGWIHDKVRLTPVNFKEVLMQNHHIKETLNGIDSRVWSKLYPFKQEYPFEREKNIPLLLDHVQKDWRETVYTINIPMLSVSSSKSPYFELGYTKEMQKNNDHIKVNIVNDAGHDIMAEKPDEFNMLMSRFLGIR